MLEDDDDEEDEDPLVVDLGREEEDDKEGVLKDKTGDKTGLEDVKEKKKEAEAKCDAKQLEQDAAFKKSPGLCSSLWAERRRCDELRARLKTATACKTRLEGEIRETEEALRDLQLDVTNSKTAFEKFKGEAAEALKGMEQRPEVVERVQRMKVAILQSHDCSQVGAF